MRVTTYKTLLDKDRKPQLVKEKTVNYTGVNAMQHPLEIADVMNAIFNAKDCTEEHVWVIGMNTKMKPIGIIEVSHGLINGSLVTPREVFTKVSLMGAIGFVLVHNHPSGDTSPSTEDIDITKKIKECGKLMNIQLIDHLIIGEGYFSFEEHNCII